MNPNERVQRVLHGQQPDRPPVGFWHHFPPDQVSGPAAVAAHLAHLEAFDLDFLKIMNDNGYPHAAPLTDVHELAALPLLHGDEAEFGRQLDLIADLRRALRGRVLMTTTVFNAWATLRGLLRPPTAHRPPVLHVADPLSNRILEYFAQDPHAVRSALHTIGSGLARFAARCLQAGADGVFVSVRDDWLQRPGDASNLYDDLVRPSDRQILDAASTGTFNVLHVCGQAVDFRAFAAYPVHVINWADRAAGPPIAAVRDWLRPAICAGVDNLTTLPTGTPADCAHEVADALRQAGARPMLIAPGCTYDPDRVPRANLEAVCQAARQTALQPQQTGPSV